MSLDGQHKKVLEFYNRRVENILAEDSCGASEIDPVNTFVDPSDLGSLNERSFFNDGKTAMNGVAILRQ